MYKLPPDSPIRDKNSAFMRSRNFTTAANKNLAPDELRCRARCRARGDRCRRWALRGGHYCEFHGGKRKHAGSTVRVHHMPRFYGKVLTRTLRKSIDEFTACTIFEQFDLTTELALMRDVAEQMIVPYARVRQALADAEENNADQKRLDDLRNTLAGCAALMYDALGHVKHTAEVACRIDGQAKDKVSIFTLQNFCDQVARCAYEAFGEDEVGMARAAEFARLVEETVKIPEHGDGQSSGTTLTPDQDVMVLDASVPKVPPVC